MMEKCVFGLDIHDTLALFRVGAQLVKPSVVSGKAYLMSLEGFGLCLYPHIHPTISNLLTL